MKVSKIFDRLFNTPPSTKEYILQKRRVADKWCRHLKGYDIVTLTDWENDTTVNIKTCKLCGVEL
jgi:hypothetical protein